MKNAFLGLSQRFNTAKEKITESEDRLREITQMNKKEKGWSQDPNRASKTCSIWDVVLLKTR